MLPALSNNGTALATTPVNRLTSLFDRFFDDDLFAPLTAAPAWSALPLSMWDDEHNVYVEIDTPGVAEKDIDLSMRGDELVIRGERKVERTGGGYDTRTYGKFEQRVTLPVPVDADAVEAKLANGVLTVTCPKSEEAKPRKIAIKSA
jgi:HSP20 family protein